MKGSSQIRIEPLTPAIGAEVIGADLRHVTPALVEGVRAALLEHKVVFFRQQNLTREQHIDFARQFGQLEIHPATPKDQPNPEVLKLSHGPESRGSENMWHSDVTWREQPSLGSVLRAIEIPQTGGDTLFANMALAYVNGAFTSHIKGMEAGESELLLDKLFKSAWNPELQCRFRWQAGSIAFWDNRASQHFAASDYFPAVRVMERVTIAGDKPYFDAAA